MTLRWFILKRRAIIVPPYPNRVHRLLITGIFCQCIFKFTCLIATSHVSQRTQLSRSILIVLHSRDQNFRNSSQSGSSRQCFAHLTGYHLSTICSGMTGLISFSLIRLKNIQSPKKNKKKHVNDSKPD